MRLADQNKSGEMLRDWVNERSLKYKKIFECLQIQWNLRYAIIWSDPGCRTAVTASLSRCRSSANLNSGSKFRSWGRQFLLLLSLSNHLKNDAVQFHSKVRKSSRSHLRLWRTHKVREALGCYEDKCEIYPPCTKFLERILFMLIMTQELSFQCFQPCVKLHDDSVLSF